MYGAGLQSRGDEGRCTQPVSLERVRRPPWFSVDFGLTPKSPSFSGNFPWRLQMKRLSIEQTRRINQHETRYQAARSRNRYWGGKRIGKTIRRDAQGGDQRRDV